MKTVTYGTLEEWSKHNPNAALINRKHQHKFTSNGAYITNPTKHKEPYTTTYHSRNRPDDYTDYAPPFFFIGSSCPYVVKAEHKYSVSINTIYGSGVPSYPIEEWLWNDPNWEEIEKIEDCWQETQR